MRVPCPQKDEAEAQERVRRWRELKEAVEELDDKEKRVRVEVPLRRFQDLGSELWLALGSGAGSPHPTASDPALHALVRPLHALADLTLPTRQT